jgi:hypothetical protein
MNSVTLQRNNSGELLRRKERFGRTQSRCTNRGCNRDRGGRTWFIILHLIWLAVLDGSESKLARKGLKSILIPFNVFVPLTRGLTLGVHSIQLPFPQTLWARQLNSEELKPSLWRAQMEVLKPAGLCASTRLEPRCSPTLGAQMAPL